MLGDDGGALVAGWLTAVKPLHVRPLLRAELAQLVCEAAIR
jgi:hypothetical protein